MIDETKKNKIIINEIQQWKESKLLPETYCDFLLALYTKGDGSEQIYTTKTSYIQWIKITGLILIVPIVLLLIYFSNINPVIQLAILFLFLISSFILYYSLNKADHFFNQVALVICLFLVLVTTISLSKHFFNKQYITNTVIFVNFITWFIISRKNKLTYLLIVSVIACLFMAIYVVL